MWKCVSSGTPRRAGPPDEELHAVRREHAERVDQADRIDVAVLGDPLQQVQVVGQPRAGRVDREERHREAQLVCQRRGLDRGVDRALDGPAVRRLDQVMARRDLHDDAVDSAVGGALDVVDHAA
jgi:hypothetical protein